MVIAMNDCSMQLRVLVVEDNGGAAEMISAILGNDGFDVAAVALNGAEALEAIVRQPFDVAIVDLELPDMAGDELLRLLRKRSPSTMLVACSAHESHSRPVRRARELVDAVIPKSELARSGALIRELRGDVAGGAA